jgi:3-oxoacyl-[acyl-carrier-protein] synthase II
MTEVVITGFAVVRAPDLDALPDGVRARASRTERVTQLAFSAAGPALAMAGLATTDGDPRPRMGIVLGTAFGCFLTNAAYQRRLAAGGPGAASPRLFAATVSNAAAGELAIAYRLGGPAITLTAGGVGGLVAIGHAVDMLRAEQADVIVAGGMDAVGEALDRWIDDGGLAIVGPATEGAAMLVLERRAHAEARAARILGSVCGWCSGFERGELDDKTLPDVAARAMTEAGLGDTASSVLAWARSWEPGDPGWTNAFPSLTSREPLSIGGFAATGPAAIVFVLDRLGPGEAGKVTDTCPSGHVAAVVVRKVA